MTFLLFRVLARIGVTSGLDFNHSNRCVVISHCCFNLQFLVTYDKEYLLICFYVICVFCGAMSVQVFCVFIWVFLLLSFKSFKSIIGYKPMDVYVFAALSSL